MILDDIVAGKKKCLAKQKTEVTLEEMKKKAEECKRVPISFYDALKKEGLSIIGELKKASPSLGTIKKTIPVEDRINQYNDSVDAISCLTEENYFKGSAKDLMDIRKLTNLPIIRKDFTIDEYQIYEAKVIGADAILLIAAILEDEKMQQFYQLAKELGLDALVEVHNEEEMERALKLNPKIIGVNNRNLKDFTIQLETTKRLRKFVEKGKYVFVAESGIMSGKDIETLKDEQVDAVLVGGALMQSENPQMVAKELREAYDA